MPNNYREENKKRPPGPGARRVALVRSYEKKKAELRERMKVIQIAAGKDARLVENARLALAVVERREAVAFKRARLAVAEEDLRALEKEFPGAEKLLEKLEGEAKKIVAAVLSK